MALLPITLAKALVQVLDKSDSQFVGFPLVRNPDGSPNKPLTNQAVANNWAAAAETYYRTLTVPAVNPLAHEAAKSAFGEAMTVFLNDPSQILGIKGISAGFAAYVAVLAVPVNLLVPGAAIPPLIATLNIVIPPLPPVIPADPSTIAKIAASTIAGQIDLWTRTGTFITGPGVTLPWA